MIVKIKQIILFLLIFPLAGQVVFPQDHNTRNNFTGLWETPASWNPAWPVPQTNVNNSDITINGYITSKSSLSFSGSSSKLIVDDTLVIIGDLTINDNNDVQVNNNGILIVMGNIIVSENSHIIADGYIIITGNITKLGSTNNGSFLSNDNPVKVFIGGTILPTSLTINKPNYIALQCPAPTTIQYPHSGCSYGDMTDIITDPIYPFFQSICNTTTTLTSSDADNSFCAGTSVTFTAGGGTNFNFRVNGTSVQNGGSKTYTTTKLTNGSIVDVLVTGTGCTGLPAGITNTVFNLPVAIGTSNSPVCTGSPLTLTGGPAGMTAYSWTGPDGFTSNTQNPNVSPASTVAMAGSYSLTITDLNGCIDSMTQSVIVNENPIAIAGPDQELEFIFETHMKAELSSSETGEWSLISGSGRISDIHSPNTLVTELSSGENIFLWKVQNGNCEASQQVKITVHDLFIPSVITPDGDGSNDYFKISENIGKVGLIIFNRWGIEEYTSDGYKNDWDGRNNKGAELPFDTYFYILKFEDGEIRKGSVLIKR